MTEDYFLDQADAQDKGLLVFNRLQKECLLRKYR